MENSLDLAIGQPNSSKKKKTKKTVKQFLKKSFLSCIRAPNVLRYTKHRASEFLNLSALFY